jgi:serine/threonine-protein kinase RsbW
VELTADWGAPSIPRDRIRACLRAYRWLSAHIDDLVLAIDNAVTHSIEHGYGMDTDDTCRVEVRGRIVPAPDACGTTSSSSPTAERG